jgi:hypothetical protein
VQASTIQTIGQDADAVGPRLQQVLEGWIAGPGAIKEAILQIIKPPNHFSVPSVRLSEGPVKLVNEWLRAGRHAERVSACYSPHSTHSEK